MLINRGLHRGDPVERRAGKGAHPGGGDRDSDAREGQEEEEEEEERPSYWRPLISSESVLRR